MENMEYLALLKCKVELTSEISADPLSVSSALVAKGLIPDSVHSSVQLQTIASEKKASEIVCQVTNKVRTFPAKFDEFLEVLGSLNWLKDVLKLITDAYGELKSQDKKVSVSGDATHLVEGSPLLYYIYRT